MAAPSEKLKNCEVCNAVEAKYTCPKCEVRTCCISCVKIHKKELECDGIRDKTKFIPKNQFTDLDLLSDYRLLEEVGRSVDQMQRDDSKKFTRLNNLPVHLHKMRHAAFRNGIKLVYLPQNFTRHKENTTYLNWKTNELFWRIEWIFPQAENIKWITKRALQSERLSSLVENILEPLKSTSEPEDDDVQSKEILHNKLQFYRAAGLTGIKVLLKAEQIKKSNYKFHILDLTLSLQENLARKSIIEFPTIYIVLKDHLDVYEIIDSDEEEEEEEKVNDSQSNFAQRRKRGLRKNNSNNDKKKAPVNFFFHDDLSDSEE
ncbi:hypothetical protein PV325_010922 [Microctonus aethiopoides]|nr:hypothetical protein PV325_010922 [Microctonus aethiopoides]